MDFGRTLQVFTFISKMNPREQSIVICPASLVSVWKSEPEKSFAKLNIQIFSVNANLDDANVHIEAVSETQMRRHRTTITNEIFQFAVFDEVQCIGWYGSPCNTLLSPPVVKILTCGHNMENYKRFQAKSEHFVRNQLFDLFY
jgi:hypothetical protein